MERSAGLAPAFPDWKSGILLLDDDCIVKMKTNTAASPVMDSHPQDNFSADLSVFQAHLPWRKLYINTVMPKPLVCISSRAGNRDNAGPLASHGFMTHLTVDSRAATVIAVDHSQSVSLGDYSGLSADSPRRQLLLAAGFFTPGGLLIGNHVDGMVWFE
jgi:hypothetical protein